MSQTQAVNKRRAHFGKNLLFCANPDAESGWVIEQYRSKDRVEYDFKLSTVENLLTGHDLDMHPRL